MTDAKQNEANEQSERLSAGELGDDQLEHVSGGAAYLKLDGIKGEVSGDGHKKWINVESFGQTRG